LRNIKLTIQYDGTDYSGWQTQANSRSIQGEIESALKNVLGSRAHVKGAGRTDAGAHALGQTANFKTRTAMPADRLRKAINSRLPHDIVIRKAEDIPERFDSQLDAVSKVYRYTIFNSDFINPLLARYAALVPYKLDMKTMKRAAKLFIGRHDFRSFQKTGSNVKTTRRSVKYLKIKKRGKVIEIDIEADGFLYNMFRTIVGTLVEVGRGKMPASQVKDILSAPDRRLAGPTAPANGLCLVRVKY
jgi:tRNA pseudouridine38-40 synthase